MITFQTRLTKKGNIKVPIDILNLMSACPGDDVIVPTAGSCGTAKERMETQTDEQYCLDWFLCFRKSK